jgi:hypothetical protein
VGATLLLLLLLLLFPGRNQIPEVVESNVANEQTISSDNAARHFVPESS